MSEIDQATVEQCATYLREKAKGFRKAAFEQGKRAGPLAMGFEVAADEIAALASERALDGTLGPIHTQENG